MSYRQILTGIAHKLQGQFQGHDSGNAPALLNLGGFKFSLNTAVFQELQRDTAFGWAWQDRIGQNAAGQFTGPGADTITLPGIVYPDFKGGAGQLNDLRALAAEGKPLRLITGGGDVLGLWVVESITEGQSAFKPDGTFRRQEFAVTLRKWGDDADL